MILIDHVYLCFSRAHLDAKPVHSDDSDDETPNGGDYTVYECPGLAPVNDLTSQNSFKSTKKLVLVFVFLDW